MKVIYAVPVELDVSGGHVQHILGLCRHASKCGVEIELLCLVGKSPIPKENFTIKAMNSVGMRPFEKISMFSKFALEEIKRNREIDLVYCRPFPMDYYFFTRHLKKLSLKFAYELNTLWRDELRSQRKHIKALIYPWMEKKSIKAASALLPVTEEIANFANTTNKPCLVTGNGIEIPEEPLLSREEIRNKWKLPLNKYLIVMAGYTRPWHGFEKLISSLVHLPENIDVVLIGSENEKRTRQTFEFAESLNVRSRTHVLPWLKQDDVDEVLYVCDLGVSPLALEKKKMLEAQSLKVRHYLALGLPVLIAGGESSAVLESGFTLQIPDTKLSSICRGILELKDKSFVKSEIRQFAKRTISWENISFKTWTFLKHLNT